MYPGMLKYSQLAFCTDPQESTLAIATRIRGVILMVWYCIICFVS